MQEAQILLRADVCCGTDGSTVGTAHASVEACGSISHFLRESGLWIALETCTLFYVPLVSGSPALPEEYRNFDLGDDIWKMQVYSAHCLVRRRLLALASVYGGTWINFSTPFFCAMLGSTVDSSSGPQSTDYVDLHMSVHGGFWTNSIVFT